MIEWDGFRDGGRSGKMGLELFEVDVEIEKSGGGCVCVDLPLVFLFDSEPGEAKITADCIGTDEVHLTI